MTYRPEQFGACEAAKIAPLVVPYLQGKMVLDIGSGPGKVWPSVIGIDSALSSGRPITDMALDGTDLSLFAANSIDAIFSSFLLHHIERSKIPNTLLEWSRVLKIGGYMVLYLPNALLIPKPGEDGADPLQKWSPKYGDIENLLEMSTQCGWELIETQRREENDEYGLFMVARKAADGWCEKLWKRNPEAKRRALVIRYGAYGDAIVAASVLSQLKKKGFHVTMNCIPKIEEVLRHDPNIDEWLIQADDFVPNELLGPYWAGLEERYDHIVNLSESVEGLLLTLPGRLNHGYSYGARRKLYDDVSYLEHTHNIADVPYDFSGSRFYATEDEKKWAQAVRARMEGPVIVWCINGSSVHKVYPYTQIVSKWLLDRTPAHIMLYGDPGVGKKLQDAIMECLEKDGADMARVHAAAGKWQIRQSLAFAQVANVIVGPETGPLNAMAMESVPKIIYLSHSSANNLTQHWVNTVVMEPDIKKVPCFPCHRLHSTWQYCHKDDRTGAALCASNIKPEALFKAIANKIGGKLKAGG